MIMITKLAASILIQKDGVELVIDDAAIPATLSTIIRALVDCGTARREGYEDGLIQGRINATIEHETSLRIAAREVEEMIATIGGAVLASAA